MKRRVVKWAVPVDDQNHPIGTGPVLHVGCQDGARSTVTVWTEEPVVDVPGRYRWVRVFGTIQPIPEGFVHIGSAVAGPFVWHVYGERP